MATSIIHRNTPAVKLIINLAARIYLNAKNRRLDPDFYKKMLESLPK